MAVILGCWGASVLIGFKAALGALAIAGFVAAILGIFRDRKSVV